MSGLAGGPLCGHEPASGSDPLEGPEHVKGSVLVAGVGNIFLSADGFGVEVVRQLCNRQIDVPPSVTICDYGIRGVHLVYELLNGYDTLILVDAMATGEVPGTVSAFEVDPLQVASPGEISQEGALYSPQIDSHAMKPDVVLSMLASLGGTLGKVIVVGCEPLSTEESMGLSGPVAAAVDRAAEMVIALIGQATTHTLEEVIP